MAPHGAPGTARQPQAAPHPHPPPLAREEELEIEAKTESARLVGPQPCGQGGTALLLAPATETGAG